VQRVKLIIQPGDSVGRIVKAIRKAKKSVEVVIFRFDRPEIARALADAAERGIVVHALIAFTNRGGEETLRKLEMRFLEDGITVARTAGDLVRYHGKMMIIDRKELFLLAFNFTHMDMERSRSFGLITRNPKAVAEAVRLFEADTKRQEYTPGYSKFLVSPVNARKELAKFIRGAKKELLIYDPKVSDRAMLRLLSEKQKAGVEVRVLGQVSGNRLSACDLKRLRLHTRTIIRDGAQAFIGSQSLRQVELDARREIGFIFRDGSVMKDLVRTFEEDWATSAKDIKQVKPERIAAKSAIRKVAKKVAKKLPLTPVAKKVAKVISKKVDVDLDTKKIHESVEEIMQDVAEKAAEKAAVEAAKSVA
jgi:phosphatidylserine/phosphatidylglycerophosphate/cardiolipin synthase-like enzyme